MFNQEKQYLTREQIQDINNKLYKIESELEGIGRQTCSVYSGGQYWSTVATFLYTICVELIHFA